jgi:TfoX/Sxy family transcriptional regulator of competence genes
MEKGAFTKATEDDKAWFFALLPEHPDVTTRPMFGNVAGFVNGNIFLCLFGPTVAVRLDEQDRAALLAHEGAGPFEPMPGRPMKEYVVLPPQWREDDKEQAAGWVRRSLEYVAELPPKEAKPRKAAPTRATRKAVRNG